MQNLKVRIGLLLLIWSVFFGFYNSEQEIAKKNQYEYPEHLIGAFTGGFGEKTCHSCHFDYDLNWEEGSLEISGLPQELIPGESYSIKIEVIREDMGKAGFQISARDKKGAQSGVFNISDNKRVMLTNQVSDSLQYVQHSFSGTEPVKTGVNNWVIEWVAPKELPDTTYFNISSNAANGDESAFGDWIYVKEVKATSTGKK